MIDKIENAVIRAFLKVKLELMKLESEEDGMETLEAIVLIAVAVIIAGVIVNALQSKGGNKGFIEKIFDWILEKLKTIGT